MDCNTNEQSFAKYFMISSTDSSQFITKASPFQISKDLQGIVQGRLDNITKLANWRAFSKYHTVCLCLSYTIAANCCLQLPSLALAWQIIIIILVLQKLCTSLAFSLLLCFVGRRYPSSRSPSGMWFLLVVWYFVTYWYLFQYLYCIVTTRCSETLGTFFFLQYLSHRKAN